MEKPESDEDELDTEEEVEENRSRVSNHPDDALSLRSQNQTPLLEDRAFGNFTIAGGSGSSHEPSPIVSNHTP